MAAPHEVLDVFIVASRRLWGALQRLPRLVWIRASISWTDQLAVLRHCVGLRPPRPLWALRRVPFPRPPAAVITPHALILLEIIQGICVHHLQVSASVWAVQRA